VRVRHGHVRLGELAARRWEVGCEERDGKLLLRA
jgi:hypothetical protein